MTLDVPKDTTEQYLTGTALTGAYQTSGNSPKDGATVPTAGQADSFNVTTTARAFDAAQMTQFMDKLSAATSTLPEGATGATAAIGEAAGAAPGSKAFNVVAGMRGDSQVSIIRVDRNGKVSIDALTHEVPETNAFYSEYGEMGEAGANNIVTKRVELKPGERAFIVTSTDGFHDAYLGKGEEALKNDVAAYLRANPDAKDLSRALSARATALGTHDNTTMVTTALDSKTDLKGQTVVASVFDGVGKGTEGNGPGTSAALTQTLAQSAREAVPEGKAAFKISAKNLPHISLREEELKRAQNIGGADPQVKEVARAINRVDNSKVLSSTQPSAVQPPKPAAQVSLSRAPRIAAAAPPAPKSPGR